MTTAYNEESIKSLDWREHIRSRPGMYIGKLGDGAHADDGIYVLVKEIVDNSIDEFNMKHGDRVEVTINDKSVTVRDFGRGIPLGKMVECVSKINTGGKYEAGAFQKSIGLNGVGTKAVNALSSHFRVASFRDGLCAEAWFEKGILVLENKPEKTAEPNGTLIEFEPDESLFCPGKDDDGLRFRPAYLHDLFWNYAYLNGGLKLYSNGVEYHSSHGLKDLLQKKTEGDELCYDVVHLKDENIEIALTHTDVTSTEQYYSFVNGQYTTMGGTHQAALREAIVKVARDFYKKQFEPQDVRAGFVAAICIRIQDPVFESQTKTKLGSMKLTDDGQTIRGWISDFLSKHLEDALHKNSALAQSMLRRIMDAERERKELAGIQKTARERAKKANLFNKKLRDCKYHLGDKDLKAAASTLFITEGDSASGSITKARDAHTQAVFSLRGKPLNCHGMKKKIVYENEELNLLLHAINGDGEPTDLRYNHVVIATDADVDGLHIRLLLLTYFFQFFPEMIEGGHLYILQTPLFRVRDKSKTVYCYSDAEKDKAINSWKGKYEITRFKGLGEISPDEFEGFIGKSIRLEKVPYITDEREIAHTINFYMGKNTPERKEFIVQNLVSEDV